MAAELVKRDEQGAPIFGRDRIDGWRLEQAPPRERTLRNALLAALSAEDAGDAAKAYKIWTYRLNDGQAVWQAIQAGLPHHVAYLGGVEAGFDWSAERRDQHVDTISRSMGARPAYAHWQPESNGVTVHLYEWPSKTWAALVENTAGMFRPLRIRPKSPQGPGVQERLEIDCSEPHTRNAFGEVVSEPHTLAECHEPTMADHLGEDLPHSDAYVPPEEDAAHTVREQEKAGQTYGEPDAATLEAAQDLDDPRRLTAKQIEFVLALDLEANPRAQRKSQRYRPCEICLGVVDHGARYYSATGRRRAHDECARQAAEHIAARIAAICSAAV